MGLREPCPLLSFFILFNAVTTDSKLTLHSDGGWGVGTGIEVKLYSVHIICI